MDLWLVFVVVAVLLVLLFSGELFLYAIPKKSRRITFPPEPPILPKYQPYNDYLNDITNCKPRKIIMSGNDIDIDINNILNEGKMLFVFRTKKGTCVAAYEDMNSHICCDVMANFDEEYDLFNRPVTDDETPSAAIARLASAHINDDLLIAEDADFQDGNQQ